MTPEVKAKVEKWLWERGMERGEARGREPLLAVALELAGTKLAAFTAEDEAAIRGRDTEALGKLVSALARAVTPAEARAALNHRE